MNLDIFKKEDKSGTFKKEVFVSNRYPEEYNYIINWCASNNLSELPFKLKVYHCINDLKYIPVCQNENCNNHTILKNSDFGYNQFCSNKCMSGSSLIVSKKKQNSLVKYGVENPQQLESVKQKAIQTNQERYGVDHAILNPDVKQKAIDTLMVNYGVTNPNKSKEILKKRVETFKANIDQYKESYKATSLEKYGTEHPWQNKEIHDKGIEQAKQILYDKLYNITLERLKTTKDILINIDAKTRFFTINCSKGHTYEIHRYLFQTRYSSNSCLCTVCNPIDIGVSGQEIEIVNFIKQNYSGPIIQNDRTILSGKELDIYLPELNLAIEYNGLYWHSEINKNKNYHIDKFNKCKEKNINLFMIWQDEWIYKRPIIESMLLNKLSKSNKIYARKCIIKELSNTVYKEFLEFNHIQGYVAATYKYGLYYNNELVSVMSFGKTRKPLGKNNFNVNELELLRFCNKLNTSVIGGASKLFNYFINNITFDKLISYSNSDKYDGKMYENLGFQYMGNTVPNYYWVIKNIIREYRYNYRKDKLVKMGYDINKTEIQIMYEDLNAYRVFDCGSGKWIFTKKIISIK